MGVKRTAAEVRDASGEYAPQAVKSAVPKGYKQTEVGVIPEDWKVKALSEFSDIKTGPFGSALHERDYVNDGIPIITVEHLGEHGIAHENLPLVSDEDRQRLKSYSLRAGDIVFSRVGSVDRNAIVRNSENGWLFSGRLLRVSTTDSNVYSPYLSYHFHSEAFKQRVRSVAVGQTMASLNTQLLKSVLSVLPPENEQRAIATALSDVDALLEGLDQLIAKKRDLKQAAMQQLLTGQTRLPGFEGEWVYCSLPKVLVKGDGIKIGPFGSQLKKEYLVSHGVYRVYGQENVYQNDFSFGARHLTRDRFEKLRSCEIKPGDFVISTMGTIGKCAIVPIGIRVGIMDSHLIRLRINQSKLLPTYLLHLFSSDFNYLENQTRKLSVGGIMDGLSTKIVCSLEIEYPESLEEQTAIATVLSDMDTELEALERRRAKTAALKQAMMQELLTGKTRLVEPRVSDVQVEAATSSAKGHNWAINEAVIIAVLVKHFGKEDYPLGRKRYTKLSYLLHRRVERQAEGYLKKAAGPYNPQTKYGGPEKIAKQNGYIKQYKGPKGHSGFVAADNIAQAEGYFEKWYGPEVLQWLEQFHFKTNDDLEVLTTVDMAVVELRASGKSVDVAAIKHVIASHPEWEAKLDRPAFSDANIAEAIEQNDALLGSEIVGDTLA